MSAPPFTRPAVDRPHRAARSTPRARLRARRLACSWARAAVVGRTRTNRPIEAASRLAATVLAALVLGGLAWAEAEAGAETGGRGWPRLISLNPSLSAIVLRLGAAEALVGVDDYSAKVLPELADRPRVGGLFDPSLEWVVALRPDRVLLVAGVDQQRYGEQLEALGLRVEVFENERLDQVLENVDRLGRMLDREEAAARRIEAIHAARAAVAEAVAGRRRPATVAVLDRSPLFVVGGRTFLDEMLEAVGARNLARELGSGYPRASTEWLIAVGPELLLDLTPGEQDATAFWGRWPSLPAVARDRVVGLEASRISLPGPDLDRALRALAVAVHGPTIEAAIEAPIDAGPATPGSAPIDAGPAAPGSAATGRREQEVR